MISNSHRKRGKKEKRKKKQSFSPFFLFSFSSFSSPPVLFIGNVDYFEKLFYPFL